MPDFLLEVVLITLVCARHWYPWNLKNPMRRCFHWSSANVSLCDKSYCWWAGAIRAALGVALEGSLCQGTLCSSSGACSEFLALGWCPSSPLRQQQEVLLLFSVCFGFVPVPLAHAKAFCSCEKAGHFYFFLKKRCPGSQPLTRAVVDFGGMHGTQQVHLAFWRSPLG